MPTMPKYIFVLLACICCFPSFSMAGQYKVTKVFDGNTVKVSGEGKTLRVRLVGIDAPEQGQPYSTQSRKHLADLVLDRTVFIRDFGKDPYKRWLGEVFLADTNVNIEMLRAGLVEVYRGAIPEKLDIIPYIEAEQEARNAEAGIWILGTRYISPGIWRRARKRMRALKSQAESSFEAPGSEAQDLP